MPSEKPDHQGKGVQGGIRSARWIPGPSSVKATGKQGPHGPCRWLAGHVATPLLILAALIGLAGCALLAYGLYRDVQSVTPHMYFPTPYPSERSS